VTAIRAALSFDAEHPDRPTDPGVEEQLLDRLAALDVRATFFIQGRWAEAYPETARRVVREGHLVGSHSFYHVRMPLLSAPGFDTDVRRAEAVVRSIVRVDPRPWFRLPFGTGSNRAAIHRRLAALGYRHVHWDVNAEEWRPSATARDVEEAIVAGVLERGDGAIVLLHAWPRIVPAAVERVVERLRDAGVELVGVDELAVEPEVDAVAG